MTFDDPRDGGEVNSVMVAHFGPASPFSILSDLMDLSVRKFSDKAFCYKANIATVSVILNSIAPFKIFNSIVGLVSVNVIHFWEIVRIWDESKSHKPVNSGHFPMRVSSKSNGNVTSLVWLIVHRATTIAANAVARSPASSGSIKTPYSAMVADFVEVAEWLKSKLTPFLSACGIHLANSPRSDSWFAEYCPACRH
jgi:hypothetical protein